MTPSILRLYFQVDRWSTDMQNIGLYLFLHCTYFTHLVTAGVNKDVTNQNLTAVPTNLPTELTHLNLARNLLNTLNAGSFPNYTKLIHLDVTYNRLEVIEDGTFDQHTELQCLYLSHNNIRQLPSYFGPPVTKLLEWYMYDGYETSTTFKPPYFASFTRLTSLQLRGVPMETFQGPSILPGSLLHFYLSRTIITSFPNLSFTPKLQSLFVYSCGIQQIPHQHINALIKLKYFNLNSNKLTSMPNLSHMPLLSTLGLSDNLLQEVPRNHISGLASLKWLYLSRNVLQIMPNVSYLSKLIHVDLSRNEITEVPASTLVGITKLLTLKLNNNKISVLGDISALWAHVYLKNNNLATLPDFYDMKLETLMLKGNPLSCNQSLCWLRMWPWYKPLPTLDDAYCTAPSEMSMVKATRVHPTKLQCFNGMASN